MVSIDPNCNELRPLAEYARRLPSSRRGKRLNRATLWRWALRGTRGGRRLQTVCVGSGRMTCDAWVWEFVSPPGTLAADAQAGALGLPADARRRIARELGVGRGGRSLGRPAPDRIP